MKIDEENVFRAMDEKGITQRQMAKDLSISPTTLNGYLHGKYLHVPDDVIRQIANYLDVPIACLIDLSTLFDTETCKLSKTDFLFLDSYCHLDTAKRKKVAAFSMQLLHHNA